MKKIIIIIVIIAVIAGGFLIYKNRFSASKTSAEITGVKLQEAEQGNIVTRVNADGIVEISQKEEVKTKLNGIIENILIQEGDFVERGDKIVSLEDEIFMDNLETARLNLKEARANYQKLLNTYNNQDNVNNLKLEDAKRNLEIAELTLEKEKIRLEDQRNILEKKVEDTEDMFKKAKNDLKEKKYLYENGAIPEKTLKESRETYQKAEREYETAKENFAKLINKTMPNDIRLAGLKVENAKNNLELLKATIAEDKISKNDLEMAKLRIRKNEKEISNIEKNLNRVSIKSPINGTVVKINVKKDDKVMEGTTLAVIADLNNLLIEAMVDEIDINDVEDDQEVKISSDSFDGELNGNVSYIAPTGTKSGNINKYRTEIKIENERNILKPGMFVNTEILTNKHENVIVLPAMAVREDGKEKYVFIAEDGIAKKRNIEIGLKSISKVEVNGIKEGEKVIIGPFNVLKNLKDGQSVTGMTSEQKKN